MWATLVKYPKKEINFGASQTINYNCSNCIYNESQIGTAQRTDNVDP